MSSSFPWRTGWMAGCWVRWKRDKFLHVFRILTPVIRNVVVMLTVNLCN